MNEFIVNNVHFIIENTKISLDKSCDIIKEKTNLKLKQENKHIEQVEKLRTTITNLQNCLDTCNAINTCFKKCYNIQCLNILYPETQLSKDIVEKINNSLTNRTANIFNINDIYYLKRLIKEKKETLANYENRKFTNNNTHKSKRNIQRQKLLGIKK